MNYYTKKLLIKIFPSEIIDEIEQYLLPKKIISDKIRNEVIIEALKTKSFFKLNYTTSKLIYRKRKSKQ